MTIWQRCILLSSLKIGSFRPVWVIATQCFLLCKPVRSFPSFPFHLHLSSPQVYITGEPWPAFSFLLSEQIFTTDKQLFVSTWLHTLARPASWVAYKLWVQVSTYLWANQKLQKTCRYWCAQSCSHHLQCASAQVQVEHQTSSTAVLGPVVKGCHASRTVNSIFTVVLSSPHGNAVPSNIQNACCIGLIQIRNFALRLEGAEVE